MEKDQILEEITDIRRLISELNASRCPSSCPGLGKILNKIMNLLENVWLGDDE